MMIRALLMIVIVDKYHTIVSYTDSNTNHNIKVDYHSNHDDHQYMIIEFHHASKNPITMYH